MISENHEFVAFALFASRFPFEMAVFPQGSQQCFQPHQPRADGEIGLDPARFVAEVGSYFGRAALQFNAAGQTFPASQSRVLEFHRRRLPLAHGDTAADCSHHRMRMGIRLFLQFRAPRSSCPMSLACRSQVTENLTHKLPTKLEFPAGPHDTHKRHSNLKRTFGPRVH